MRLVFNGFAGLLRTSQRQLDCIVAHKDNWVASYLAKTTGLLRTSQRQLDCMVPHKDNWIASYLAKTTGLLRTSQRQTVNWSLFLIVFILSVNGCVNPFNPHMNDYRGSSKGLPNTTPYNVLRNLETAYNQKNLDLYISTLDKNFHFQANPDVEPEIGVTWWGYDVEIEFHRNLFSRGNSNRSLPVPNIITLSITIPPETEWFEDRQVSHEGWVIIRSGFYLRLSFSGQSDLTASGVAQFHMKPVGNRWYIGKWVDMSN